jgi:neutral ceramidase
MKPWLILLSLAAGLSAAAPEWRAGTAAINITPSRPLWLAGFASRTHPSDGVVAPIHAKALVLQDRTGARSVLVTADILGFTERVSTAVAARIQTKLGIPRERIAFNGSHTHWGPVIDRQLSAAYPMTPAQWTDVDAYSRELVEKVTQVIGDATAHLRPAKLSYAEATASFAINYRLKTPKGYVHKPNPAGVVDHSAPVMRIEDANGKLLAALFGYACHPTVSSGDSRLYQFHGDYAGFAQSALEREFPGATAMFVQGFGGDAKGDPRGSVALAEKHGAELAANVAAALRTPGTPVHGPIAAAFDHVTLEIVPRGPRAEWERRTKDRNFSVALNAKDMLAALDHDGHLPLEYSYPIQVWRFGKDLTFVAMGGETLIDYAFRFRKELGVGRLWLAGYSNDVSCYIPPVRVLEEGGYEANDSMIYYSRAGSFAPSLEERIVSKTKELVRRAK